MKLLIALSSCRRLASTPPLTMHIVYNICTLTLEVQPSTSPVIHTRAWGPQRGQFRKNLSKRQVLKIMKYGIIDIYLPLSCAGN